MEDFSFERFIKFCKQQDKEGKLWIWKCRKNTSSFYLGWTQDNGDGYMKVVPISNWQRCVFAETVKTPFGINDKVDVKGIALY